MITRKTGLILLASFLTLGALWGAPRIRLHPNPMTVPEIQTLIAQEAPMGTSVANVLHFLDAKKIEHSEYLAETLSANAVVRRTSVGILIEGSIYIRFIFDGEGKLQTAEVEEVFTGL